MTSVKLFAVLRRLCKMKAFFKKFVIERLLKSLALGAREKRLLPDHVGLRS
jgi:hypothetical protein